MFRNLRIFLAALIGAGLATSPASANIELRYHVQYTVVSSEPAEPVSERFLAGDEFAPDAIAAYGPFRVLDDRRAALVGTTDSDAPERFAAMLDDYPALAMLELIEVPGTYDDIANLELGRMIRAAGMATYVPANGSVRSGGVELLLAGVTRFVDPQSEFAVHQWRDDTGRSALDYPPQAHEHSKYLDYYLEMGFDRAGAQAFYDMTNEAPFERARWLSGIEMARWLGEDTQLAEDGVDAYDAPWPQLAYAEL